MEMSHDEGNTALHLAVLNSQLERIEELLAEPEIDCDKTNFRGETPLFLSLKNNCSDDIVLTLIENGCNVNISNDKNVTPLHLAVQRRTNLIAFKLIEKGADIRARDGRHGCTPLHRAVVQGRRGLLRELLKLDLSLWDEPNRDFHQTPLLYGLEKRCGDKILLFLIDHGCNVNISDFYGQTALHYAVARDSTLITKTLIERGANINARDKSGFTPLHIAALEPNLEYVYMLLYYNASACERDVNGLTPFHSVLRYKRDDCEIVARSLLDYIVDINERDYDGFSILHTALLQNFEIALDLVKRGADVNALYRDIHCLSMASSHSSPEVFEAIWHRTDFQLLRISNELGDYHKKSFLEVFIRHSVFENEQFLKYLYLIFASPYVEQFLHDLAYSQTGVSLIEVIVTHRDLPLNQRLEMLYVCLSYGTEVYYNDINLLYKMYGFDESVELLLTNGCCIMPNNPETVRINLIVSRICYDNLDMYAEISQRIVTEENRKLYNKYYRKKSMAWEQPFCTSFIPSLLELSRNVIRDRLYKRWRTPYSFNVYQAITKLPLPPMMRDVLFLKRPIY